MKNIKMDQYNFKYQDDIMCVYDNEKQKIAFISKYYDLLLLVEKIDGHLNFQPELSVNIVEDNQSSYIITTSD
ncbi:hypothetical protein [Apilactobacillus xinyiensis]|uniref:Uncharacterized protein n=1 Tax=Apilactobacillus xinyiensis TaxID=2841032 RepID=A0ABT0I2C4_9LACO|nr:hypothetical protein [Apilactobacillus xinyiensis]MCK8624878.1 hypothetical protein [Apilactobacillus xinyiensis]MCL0312230.1 hypothetical protein [Apilactobacillus xinyiensis]MCL0319359.1 hypothetical protein [Apilactobacillus xinyiensis]MCL0329757.1 hypothetical protein [Apilactobacillus xinyiensis]